jgi:hypothetical protein
MSDQQPPVNPIVWDSDDDFLGDANQQNEKERALSPPPGPFVPKELYLMCLRCPSVTMIEYGESSNLDTKIDCALPGQVQLLMTICRTCLVNNGDCPNAGRTGVDLLHMMRVLCISAHYVRSTKLYRFLVSDKMMHPHVLTEHEAIKYISLDKIISAMNDTCTLKSLTHCEGGYVRSHLKGGFL